MNSSIKFYIGLLILLFIGIIAIESSKPKVIDWTKTYNERHKKPFGTFVLYNELEALFKPETVTPIKTSAYEFFDNEYSYYDSTYYVSGSYLKIADYVDGDDTSTEELLNFAKKGNTVFIASSHPPQYMLDTLHLETRNKYDFKGAAKLSLTRKQFAKDTMTVTKGLENIYFSKIDTLRTLVLGYQVFDSVKRANFVKAPYGQGQVLIHLQPVVFTNYYILKDQTRPYTEAVLSYIPDGNVFYDTKAKLGEELGDTPMRYVLKQPALRWAIYLGYLAIVLFMIFNAKRKQRIVKVIKPLENTTVAFTKTIGNLYYETQDHNNLIEKKTTYFLEYIRRVYLMDTTLLDEKFSKILSLKAGKDPKLVSALIKNINILRARNHCTEQDLIQLNKSIEEFHKE